MGSSRTRARTRVPCTGRRILNHCATREVPAKHIWNKNMIRIRVNLSYHFNSTQEIFGKKSLPYDITFWHTVINCGFIVYVLWWYSLVSLETKPNNFIRERNKEGFFPVSSHGWTATFIWENPREKLEKHKYTPVTETIKVILKQHIWDFPGGAVVRSPPANAGDTGSIPGLGRSHMPRSN